MYSGKVVETGETRRILTAPAHPYTRGLLDAFPDNRRPGERLEQIKGAIVSPAQRPAGCSFRPRCAYASSRCEAMPEPRAVAPGQIVRCFHPLAAERVR
jgi:peptide/nickel transport system ATP-binding protein